MTNTKLLNQKVYNWIEDDLADSTVVVAGRTFRLEYNGNIYSIYENDTRIGWNDNHKDFRNIGYHVFALEAVE